MAKGHSARRHPNFKDLTGRRFGRLVVIRWVGNNKRGRALWLCRCDCGAETVVSAGHLLNGNTKSCGCWRIDLPQTRVTHGHHRVTKTTPEYRAWADMIQRCYNPKRKRYKTYGGRPGNPIWVCNSWRNSYETFISDMGERPSPRHSLDRIDNDKGYTCGKCPECLANGWTANVRWATRHEQANKTTRNLYVEFNGKRQTVTEWARELGIKPKTLNFRIFKAKWPLERALTTSVRQPLGLNDQQKARRAASRAAVNKAVKCRRLPHASSVACVHCGKQACHYHHHRGYEFEHRLDVLPVCQECHRD